MTKQLQFGRFLEVSGPGWEARADGLGVTAADRQALLQEFGGRLLPLGTSAAEIVATLGAPTESTEHALRYDLGVRRDYLFEFRVRPDEQTVVDSGYVRRKARDLALVLPASLAEATTIRAEMIRLGVTANELRVEFGEPEDRSGWWPYEVWTYEGPLALELRLGVVEG